jgi:hypothetical protein
MISIIISLIILIIDHVKLVMVVYVNLQSLIWTVKKGVPDTAIITCNYRIWKYR